MNDIKKYTFMIIPSIILLESLCLILFSTCSQLKVKKDPQIYVTTFAGNTTPSSKNKVEIKMDLNKPRDIAITKDGTFYIADSNNHRIQKISPEGVVSTFVGNKELGNADGPRTNARFNNPYGIVITQNGILYIADTTNHRIRKVTLEGEVSTIAGNMQGYKDGPRSSSQFNQPQKITISQDGMLYIVDTFNNCIRKVTPEGEVSTFVGSSYGHKDGIKTEAQFNFPLGITISQDGILYVTTESNCIRKITPDGIVSTFAGNTQRHKDKSIIDLQLSSPHGITITNDKTLYITDSLNHRIQKITPDGIVSIIAGNKKGHKDGIASKAQFNSPEGIAVAPDGTIYITDTNNNCIRKIEFK